VLPVSASKQLLGGLLSHLHYVSKKHKETDLCGRCGDLSPVEALSMGTERLFHSVFRWSGGTAHWTAWSMK